MKKLFHTPFTSIFQVRGRWLAALAAVMCLGLGAARPAFAQDWWDDRAPLPWLRIVNADVQPGSVLHDGDDFQVEVTIYNIENRVGATPTSFLRAFMIPVPEAVYNSGSWYTNSGAISDLPVTNSLFDEYTDLHDGPLDNWGTDQPWHVYFRDYVLDPYTRTYRDMWAPHVRVPPIMPGSYAKINLDFSSERSSGNYGAQYVVIEDFENLAPYDLHESMNMIPSGGGARTAPFYYRLALAVDAEDQVLEYSDNSFEEPERYKYTYVTPRFEIWPLDDQTIATSPSFTIPPPTPTVAPSGPGGGGPGEDGPVSRPESRDEAVRYFPTPTPEELYPNKGYQKPAPGEKIAPDYVIVRFRDDVAAQAHAERMASPETRTAEWNERGTLELLWNIPDSVDALRPLYASDRLIKKLSEKVKGVAGKLDTKERLDAGAVRELAEVVEDDAELYSPHGLFYARVSEGSDPYKACADLRHLDSVLYAEPQYIITTRVPGVGERMKDFDAAPSGDKDTKGAAAEAVSAAAQAPEKGGDVYDEVTRDWRLNDPGYPSQWALRDAHITDAWARVDRSYAGPHRPLYGGALRVCVIGSGVRIDHADLADRITEPFDPVRVNGDCYADRDPNNDDPVGDGTATAGIIAAARDNGAGIAGIGPFTIVPVSAYYDSYQATEGPDDGGGLDEDDEDDLDLPSFGIEEDNLYSWGDTVVEYAFAAEGFYWAVLTNCSVIDVGFIGRQTFASSLNVNVYDAVRWAGARGAQVVVPAGDVPFFGGTVRGDEDEDSPNWDFTAFTGPVSSFGRLFGDSESAMEGVTVVGATGPDRRRVNSEKYGYDSAYGWRLEGDIDSLTPSVWGWWNEMAYVNIPDYEAPEPDTITSESQIDIVAPGQGGALAGGFLPDVNRWHPEPDSALPVQMPNPLYDFQLSGDSIVSISNESPTAVSARFGGTGMATAHVSGMIALMLHHIRNLSPDDDSVVKDDEKTSIVLYATEDVQGSYDEDTVGWDPFTGFGFLNAYAMLTGLDNLLSSRTLGVETARFFRIYNTGAMPLEINRIYDENQNEYVSFWPPAPFEIGPASSQLCTIEIDPDLRPAWGTSVTVRIENNDPGYVWAVDPNSGGDLFRYFPRSVWPPPEPEDSASRFQIKFRVPGAEENAAEIMANIEDLVRHFYEVALERQPTAEELKARANDFIRVLGFGIDVLYIPQNLGFEVFRSKEYDAASLSLERYIQDLYLGFLDREASDVELAGWMSGSWGSTDADRLEILSHFARSSEFETRVRRLFPGYPGDGAKNFVSNLYFGILNRVIDSEGLAAAAPEIGDSIDKRQTAKEQVRSLIFSIEFRFPPEGSLPQYPDYVRALYRAFFNRFPNTSEETYWSGLLQRGEATLDQMIQLFGDSDEFTQALVACFGPGWYGQY